MPQNKSKKELNNYEEFAMSYHKDSFTPSKSKQVKSTPSYTKTTIDKQPIAMGGYDNLIPNSIGNVVDSVFGKLDSFVNTVLGESKNVKTKQTKVIKQTQEINKTQVKQPTKSTSAWGKGTTKEYDEDDEYFDDEDFEPPTSKPKTSYAPHHQPQIQKIPNLNNYYYDDEEEDQKEEEQEEKKLAPTTLKKPLKTIPKIPRITRTTPIAELNLDYKILSDPDLVKYFDQMKLYEYSIIEGGLCNMTILEAGTILSKGLWGNRFNIKFEDLNLSIGLKPIEIAKSRFKGMLPVYKACGWKFKSQAELKKAIEDDINTFLNTGKGNSVFHKFTYKIISKK